MDISLDGDGGLWFLGVEPFGGQDGFPQVSLNQIACLGFRSLLCFEKATPSQLMGKAGSVPKSTRTSGSVFSALAFYMLQKSPGVN